MSVYVVRVWLPDRPGALGQVASRIGAVGGDVIGIDILERGGGRAIDELAVALSDDVALDRLVAGIVQLDGVDVEHVRPVAGAPDDARLGGLGVAERLVRSPDLASMLEGLCRDLVDVLDLDWAAVVRLEPPEGLAVVGERAPASAWLVAFLHGIHHLDSSEEEGGAPADLAWAALAGSGLEVVAGRRNRAFRRVERRELAALARIADAWASRWRSSGRVHRPVA